MSNKELIKEVFVGETMPGVIKIKLRLIDVDDVEYHLSTLAEQLDKAGLSATVEIEIQQ